MKVTLPTLASGSAQIVRAGIKKQVEVKLPTSTSERFDMLWSRGGNATIEGCESPIRAQPGIALGVFWFTAVYGYS
jgi:hypothetical protein